MNLKSLSILVATGLFTISVAHKASAQAELQEKPKLSKGQLRQYDEIKAQISTVQTRREILAKELKDLEKKEEQLENKQSALIAPKDERTFSAKLKQSSADLPACEQHFKGKSQIDIEAPRISCGFQDSRGHFIPHRQWIAKSDSLKNLRGGGNHERAEVSLAKDSNGKCHLVVREEDSAKDSFELEILVDSLRTKVNPVCQVGGIPLSVKSPAQVAKLSGVELKQIPSQIVCVVSHNYISKMESCSLDEESQKIVAKTATSSVQAKRTAGVP